MSFLFVPRSTRKEFKGLGDDDFSKADVFELLELGEGEHDEVHVDLAGGLLDEFALQYKDDAVESGGHVDLGGFEGVDLTFENGNLGIGNWRWR